MPSTPGKTFLKGSETKEEKTMGDIRVYTMEEVCEILSITKRTVYNYIKAGKLKAFKMGKYWRVTEENLRAFIGRDTPAVDRDGKKENTSRKPLNLV
jgi:excisionase family DNA binding protein